MKVRFVLHDIYGRAGGVVTVTLDLAAELAKRHDVELVSVYGRKRGSRHPLPEGVRIINLIPRNGSEEEPARRQLRSELARHPTELVPDWESRYQDYNQYTDHILRQYVQSIRGGVLVTMQPGLIIATSAIPNRRCIRVAQDHRPFRGRSSEHLEAYRQSAKKLDMFLTLTKVDARRYRKHLGDLVPVQAMPNGTPDYHGHLSAQGSRTVVAAGRLEDSKGFDLLVDAWVRVAAAYPDWRLRIFGSGSRRAALQQQIDDRGLTEAVTLDGFTTNLQSTMSESDFFVLSSRAEGYPRVILEAMAVGLPVVSTACPTGPREMVETGVDGILVPNKDSEALGLAINTMIEKGPEARLAMGSAGRARVQSLSQAEVARRWDDMFTRLARERSLLRRISAVGGR
jgi:glycosyltransferase involved in cell wall biosynthesis